MAIKIKIKCDICGKKVTEQIKYVGQVPKGWYTLRYQPKSGLYANLDICSDQCLLDYALRENKKKKKNGGK